MTVDKRVYRKVDSVSKASALQLGAKIISVLAQIGFTAILARLLTPNDFGIVAVSLVFAGFFSQLSDFGISSAVVQFTSLKRRNLGALFSLSFLFAVALSVCFMVVSFLVAYVYQNSLYIPLGVALIPTIFFSSLNMVPNGLLLRDKQFHSIALRQIVSTVVSGVATVLLVLVGMGVYAIALNSAILTAMVFFWNEHHVRLMPCIHGIRDTLSLVWRYSAFRFGDQIVFYFGNSLDSLLCGKLFGTQVLGYYDKARTLASMPQTYLISTITSTLHPFFTECKDDSYAIWSRLTDIVKMVSIVAAVCTIGLILCSNELVRIIFGDQWLATIPLLQILALWVYPRAVNCVHGPLLLGLQRSDLLFLYTCVNTTITVGMTVFGGYLGNVEAMAVCIAVGYYIELILPTILCVRVCLKKSLLKYVIMFVPEIIASAVTLAIVFWLIPPFDNLFVSLIVKGTTILIVYCVLLMLLGQKKYLISAARSIKRKNSS